MTLTSPDEDADLPGAYKFKKSDEGKHVFKNLRLRTAGNQSLKAKSGAAQDTESISVAELTCAGENYDVNGDVDDGCEAEQPFTGRTTQATAFNIGSVSDCDDPLQRGGTLLSDSRLHTDPDVPGFVAEVGSAPAWMKLAASDDACVLFGDVSIQTTGGTTGEECYRLTVTWENPDGPESGSEFVDVTGVDFGSIEADWDFTGMDDSADINFKIEKICSSSVVTEAVDFTITYEF